MNLSPSLHDYAAVRDYLYGLKHHGAKYGIDRMRLFAEVLGHPERAFPIIHIAGTNGKGSVAAMLEAIYRRAGYKTGLYTSPHLVRQGERVQVNRQITTEAEIVALTRRLQPLAAELGARNSDDHPSFFEFMTAMAFLRFREAAVDVAMIEVGLGGRLDATNVVDPALSIITMIGHDHTEILGDTLEKIAAEKAGIIKPGRPVVIGWLEPEAEAVVRAVARERGSEVHSAAAVFGPEGEALPATNLEGSFQQRNAAVATLAVRVLSERFPVDASAVREGLRAVDWPGRWQRLDLAGREFIFDAAHNPEGAACLEENLARHVFRTGKRPAVVLGVLGARRAEWIVPIAARYASALHLVTVPHQPRSCSPDELAAFIPEDFAGEVYRQSVDEVFPAEGVCTAGEPGGSVLVTGSIYLIGEAMDRLTNPVPAGQGVLQD